jgi:TonB-linked SusC/RagA family outer membrane protein
MQFFAIAKACGGHDFRLAHGITVFEEKKPCLKKILLMTKFTAFLTFALLLQVQAKTFSQSITLSAKQEPLTKVLSELKKQSGYQFFYNDALLKTAQPVTVTLKNEPFESALQAVFQHQPLTYSMVARTVVVKAKSQNLPKENGAADLPASFLATGIVREPSGNPLEGASVVNESTSHGVSTDAAGRFSLEASENDILHISYVGFVSMQIKVTAATAGIMVVDKQSGKTLEHGSLMNGLDGLVIKLAASTAQEKEVMVNTGYQRVSRERATGSFEKVDQRIYANTISSDVMSRLEGITSGLYVSKNTGHTEYFIRGLSTITANTQPLIVIDDFPYDGNINNINPNDVESVVVLRDASAASIWGARSGNGVIVITTKKGRFNQAPLVSLNANVTVGQKPDLFYSKDFLAAPQFIDLEKELFSRGYYDADLSNVYSRPVVTPVVDLLDKERSGLLSSADVDAKIATLKTYDVRRDEEKWLYRKSVAQQYALSLSGGNNTVNYMLSLGYDQILSSSIGNSEQRATLRQSTTFKPVKWLSLQADLNYAYDKSLANSIYYLSSSSGKSLYPYTRLADDQGHFLAIEKDYRLQWIDTTGGGKLLDWHYRPLDEIKLADNPTTSHDLLAKLGLTAQVTGALSLSVNGQLEQNFRNASTLYGPDTYFARNQINRFTNINGNSVVRNLPLGGILYQTLGNMFSYSFRGQANFNQTWKKDHALNAIAGAEIRQIHSTSQNIGTYGYDDAHATNVSVDYLNAYPLYDKLGYNYIRDYSGFDDATQRFVSIYANAAYTYRNTYTFSASARKDGANLFGVSANQRGVPLWSAGAAWKLSNEAFYHVQWLPSLKLRATYGYNGNMRSDLSSVPVISYSSPARFTNLPTATVTNLSNDELRWERIGMMNLGADFSLKGDRVSGTIEYYHKNAKDLLAYTPVDVTLGINGMVYNTADMVGHGVDLKLNFRVIDGPFRWEVYALYSYVRNKVTKYLLEYPNLGAYAGSGIMITPIAGKEPYSLIVYRSGGLDPQNGDPVGYLDGKKSKDYSGIQYTTNWNDLRIVGASRPPHFGNLIQTFFWKGITLSTNISYKFGSYFLKNSINYGALITGWAGNDDYNKRWQKPGDEAHTQVPSLVYSPDYSRDAFYLNSEANVRKADLVRLQNIQLSYELPTRAGHKPVFKNGQVYLYGNNLGILWKANKDDIDPDYGTGTPNPITISMGFKTNF